MGNPQGRSALDGGWRVVRENILDRYGIVVTYDKEWFRSYYERNRKVLNARSAATVKLAAVRNRKVVDAIKAVPCADCGETYPPYVMDFDHVSGTKLSDVGSMVTRGHSEKRILQEIEKCEVVCANCHRERTHRRRTNP